MSHEFPPLDFAMMIDAAARRDDPITRFVRSLSDDLRPFAEDTIRLRAEFQQNAQRMLVCTDPHEAQRYATWIARHAHEVAYRWSMLMSAATRLVERDGEAIVRIQVSR